MKKIRVEAADFDPGAEIAALAGLGSGGLASFIGLVRGDGGLVAMTLEHYPAMTTRALEQLAEEAVSRWQLDGVILVHRTGRLVPGDRIVLVATAARHRGSALDACAFLIDRLKTEAPFWKKEEFSDGSARWVEARSSDDEAAARWD